MAASSYSRVASHSASAIKHEVTIQLRGILVLQSESLSLYGSGREFHLKAVYDVLNRNTDLRHRSSYVCLRRPVGQGMPLQFNIEVFLLLHCTHYTW